jgi:hypothetical protein
MRHSNARIAQLPVSVALVLALLATGAFGGGMARGHRIRRSAAAVTGVSIIEGYERSGNPGLAANSQLADISVRPQWAICPPPDIQVCRPVTGIAPPQGPNNEFLEPGPTVAGTVFDASVTANGQTYLARSAPWEGTVQPTSRPTLSGRARVGSPVSARGATWIGGWGPGPTWQPAGGSILGGEGPSLDFVSIEACRTRAGRHCVNMSSQSGCGFSRRPVRVDGWFSGWYLFAFDQRFAHAILCGEPGYGSAAAIPPVKLSGTVARSLPTGRIKGPPAPTASILGLATLRAGTVRVAKVRCVVSCSVRLWVDDRHTASTARVRVVGPAYVGVPRHELRLGRLDVSLQVGAGPIINGHSELRERPA